MKIFQKIKKFYFTYFDPIMGVVGFVVGMIVLFLTINFLPSLML